MQVIYFLLRALGLLFFLLLAIGYYEKSLIINGIWAAFMGALAVTPADRYPKGFRGVKMKSAAIAIGFVIAVILEALFGSR